MSKDDMPIATCSGDLCAVVRPSNVEDAAGVWLLKRMRPLTPSQHRHNHKHQHSRTEQQGSDTRVRTQNNPVGFLGYTHLKNPPQKDPHFYVNLILVYTLYATNNAIFYCFKAFKALSY